MAISRNIVYIKLSVCLLFLFSFLFFSFPLCGNEEDF